MASSFWLGSSTASAGLRAPSLGTRACLVCLDVGAVYADVLKVGVLAQFMEDLLDQAAF